MFNRIKTLSKICTEMYMPKIRPTIGKEWKIIIKRSYTPGLVPTLEHLWYDNAVAINYADDVIYRNENGVVVKYARIKEVVCSNGSLD